MAKILIHLATGPENPTRGALALLVARTAAEEGHDVQVSWPATASSTPARPPRQRLTESARAASGEHWEALVAAGVPIYLSGMSSTLAASSRGRGGGR